MNTTRNYWLFILNRALSGVVNGLYYAHSVWVWPVLFVLALFSFYELFINLRENLGEMNLFTKIMSYIGMYGSVACVIMLGISFKFPNYYSSDIHLWTFLHQTALAGTLFFSDKRPFSNIWWLSLAVSPSAFLQKVFINIIPGGNWDYEGTDDPTGHFWSMTVFGIKIMVPRLADMRVKLVIALLCVLSYLIVYYSLRNREDKI